MYIYYGDKTCFFMGIKKRILNICLKKENKDMLGTTAPTTPIMHLPVPKSLDGISYNFVILFKYLD